MNLRITTVAVFLLAGYFAFGDSFSASTLTIPGAFVADVGRGIGGAITGVASSVGTMFSG